jgi:cytochrome P450
MRWLQENAPISWQEEPRGPGYWAFTRYADVKVIESDTTTFSSQPTSLIDDTRVVGDSEHRMLISEDLPNHTSHRKFLGVEIAPAPVRALRQQADEIAHDVIDEIVEDGECDFVWAIANNMTSYMMAHVLGMSREEALGMYAASEILNSGASYQSGIGLAALQQMHAYAKAAWDRGRSCPAGGGAMARLANGKVRGVEVDELPFALDFQLLVNAAGDTTRNVIAGGMVAMFEYPDQRAMMAEAAKEGDESTIASGVEEMLRWTSPVTNQRRTVTADTEVAGHELKRGEKVTVWYGIANRDPAYFTDPWTFDVHRSPNAHLTFGFGPHFCLGSHLARLTLNAIVPKVLQRMPHLEPTGAPDYSPADPNSAPNVVGPKAMPVKFTPGRWLRS